MLPSTKQIIPTILVFLSLTIGCGSDSEFKNPCAGSWISRCAANTEILIIGPYKRTCVGVFEQECYLEFNEESQRWFFFYDGIKGFDLYSALLISDFWYLFFKPTWFQRSTSNFRWIREDIRAK